MSNESVAVGRGGRRPRGQLFAITQCRLPGVSSRGVDPWLNGGQSTVAKRGVLVLDIMSRLKAQEPARDVADDYGLALREIEDIRKVA